MGQIQDRASVLIPRLLQPKLFTLSKEEQTHLATWAVMVTMSAELTYVGRRIIEGQARHELFNARLPDFRWGVAVGRYAGSKFRNSCSSTALATAGVDNNQPKAGQVTVLIVDSLLLVTMYTQSSDRLASLMEWLSPHFLFQIWPASQREVIWPQVHHYDDITMQTFINSFRMPPIDHERVESLMRALKL